MSQYTLVISEMVKLGQDAQEWLAWTIETLSGNKQNIQNNTVSKTEMLLWLVLSGL